MSTKKCACFTPSGLVYTRLETDGTIARRPTELLKENSTRSRRSINNDVFEPNTVDGILEENPSIGHLSFKNEPVDELEKRNIENNIDKLIRETEAFLEAYERTKDNIDHKRIKRRAQHWNHLKHKKRNDPMLNNNESSLECKIEANGTVNCSQVIYNDLKAWHTNRLSLEDQIRQLRTKLEDLKEIKRHLKISKPAIEVQTINPSYSNSNLDNKTGLHDNHTKDSSRKNRIHRIKSKHRNITSFDKKFRQSNEYILPTINANTKDDIFNTQLKNETTTETVIHFVNISDQTETATNHTYVLDETTKLSTTTVTTEANFIEQNTINYKDTHSSITDATYDMTTTEFPKIHETSSSKQTKYNASPTNKWKTTTSDILSTLNSYTSAVDDIISSHKFNPTPPPYHLTTRPTKQQPARHKTSSTSLGPTRFDASEYEQINPNKGHSDNNGIFSKPFDVFQRRLHPLFIENEDKHVCYCEENR